MPPKKKITKISSVAEDPDQGVRKALIRKASEMSRSIDQEKRDAEYFRLQLEGLQSFRHNQNKRFESKVAQLKDMEFSMKSLEDNHNTTVDRLKNDIKELLLGKHRALARQQVEAESSIKVLNDFQLDQIDTIEREKRALEKMATETEFAQIELIKDMKAKHSNACVVLRQNFESRLDEILMHFDTRMKELRIFYQKRRSDLLATSEKRFDDEVKTVMQECDEELMRVKTHFTGLVGKNIEEEKSMKAKLASLSNKERRLERVYLEAKKANEMITNPLEEAKNEIDRLRQKVNRHTNVKRVLDNKRNQLILVTKDLEDLKWEMEIDYQVKEAIRLECQLGKNVELNI